MLGNILKEETPTKQYKQQHKRINNTKNIKKNYTINKKNIFTWFFHFYFIYVFDVIINRLARFSQEREYFY